MSNTTMVRARLTPDLKERAERIFHRLGLNATQAITLILPAGRASGRTPVRYRRSDAGDQTNIRIFRGRA
uniref:Addiction module antitoxin, RelB/DinJ family n=1 Tax=Candidatus Kentrum sp. LFY TaxID=2126342 RepID=A0A450WQG2_9GAMM|nr:MAG: addiction module antitoxin, RelB/DinJ family [Candidatus Kentron sp. LFY]